MQRHINYLKYVLIHKWYVLLASIRIKSSLCLAIIHDLSKFMPSEWFPYAYTFYNKNGSKRYLENSEFAIAWNYHQKRNKHHWQYWIITWDRGEMQPLVMPKRYVLEMIADWMGAGRAITGKWEYKNWYKENKKNMILHNKTKKIIDEILYKL
jgi:hypothetical protein